ncbi:hypothetical protein NLJ89_g5095 [Agrocybe chaxingu]|uniref:SCP domain-containing protein n=1 Tax=Agrocybe chaxingu TaxID=84603 RepID=A0A9W8JZ73_9AGAR|nr:hypothetical protein NLJ89_g5095 [Agrocybe chaxingu]
MALNKLFCVYILSLLSMVIASPLLEERDAWSDSVLASHNAARVKYGANPLTWDSALYTSTLQWAQGCKFTHSSGQYGENLYASTGTNIGVEPAVNAWMSEASKYNYNSPGFSSTTGHFTQVVWKSTTKVACARATCASGTIFSQPSTYVVCRYNPPGNYAGQYAQNVGAPV